MGKNSDYYIELKQKQKEKMATIKAFLPAYTHEYLDNCFVEYQPNTAVAYARDLLTFFQYLKETNPLYAKKRIKNIPLRDLDMLTAHDINAYQGYLDYNDGTNGTHAHSSGRTGIARKMSSLRNFFDYMYRTDYISSDPTEKAKKRKIDKSDTIIRMNNDEVADLMKAITNTELKSKRSRSACEKTVLRDIAIVTLLLKTGIRVSECVGLDLDDINFHENSISIVRKGGKSSVLYFQPEVAQALTDYILHERNGLIMDDTERALFISLAHRRMTARSIEKMVKKFSQESVQGKKITPHKLRSTFGTALYRESQDIYMVADALGHKNVNTTVKHYAAIDEDHRKKAAQYTLYN